jgi:hypothetical protein
MRAHPIFLEGPYRLPKITPWNRFIIFINKPAILATTLLASAIGFTVAAMAASQLF